MSKKINADTLNEICNTLQDKIEKISDKPDAGTDYNQGFMLGMLEAINIILDDHLFPAVNH